MSDNSVERRGNIDEDNKQNIPSLSFNKEEWTNSDLGSISTVQDGTHSTPHYVEEGIPFFSVETITSDVPPKYISQEEHDNLIKRCKPKQNDILLTRIGTLCESKLITWDFDFSIYVSLALISDIQIYPEFLNQYIKTNYYKKEYIKRSLLLAVPQKINLKDLKETIVKFPSISEQKKIADFLDTIDRKIELMEKKYLTLLQIKTNITTNLFCEKDKIYPLFKFSDEKWQKIILGEIGNTYSGLSGKNKEDFGIGSSFFVPYKAIFDSEIIDYNLLETVYIGSNEKQNNVQKNDILFTSSSETPEEVAMTSIFLNDYENCYLNSFSFGYRLTVDFIDPIFLNYYLRSPMLRKEFYKIAQGSTRYNISKKEIMKISIKYPSMETQEKIVLFILNINKIISNLKREINLNKEFKRSLLSKMFC